MSSLDVGKSFELKRFDLLIGEQKGDSVRSPLLAGYVIHREGGDSYLVRLFMLPRANFFMRKNQSSDSRYTIFSKMFQTADGKAHFQNPVGSGRLVDEMKGYLELQFQLFPETKIYMDLRPKVLGGAG